MDTFNGGPGIEDRRLITLSVDVGGGAEDVRAAGNARIGQTAFSADVSGSLAGARPSFASAVLRPQSRLRPWNSSSISRLSCASMRRRSLNERFLAFSSNR